MKNTTQDSPNSDAQKERQDLRVPPGSPVARREFLGGIGATIGLTALGTWAMPGQRAAAATQWQPLIRPRSDWAGAHEPTGPIAAEEPLFLLVHHTAQPGNDYIADDVPKLIRSMYWYHTSDEKGWPDLAYNFIVDQFGAIWEGRSGSLAGPVRGSATGGNQGFSQLCCFLGNLDEQDPTPAATSAMVNLLAWLAVQRQIDVRPGAAVSFLSRGSNRWAEGTSVTTPTIAGHRDMSQTGCPGDRGYAFVTGSLPALVLAKASEIAPAAYATSATDSDAATSENADESVLGQEGAEDETAATNSSTTDSSASENGADDGTESDKNEISPNPTSIEPVPKTTKERGTNADERTASNLTTTQDETTNADLGQDDDGDQQLLPGVPNWVPFAAGGAALLTAQGIAMNSRTSKSGHKPDVV